MPNLETINNTKCSSCIIMPYGQYCFGSIDLGGGILLKLNTCESNVES